MNKDHTSCLPLWKLVSIPYRGYGPLSSSHCPKGRHWAAAQGGCCKIMLAAESTKIPFHRASAKPLMEGEAHAQGFSPCIRNAHCPDGQALRNLCHPIVQQFDMHDM